MGRYGEGAVVWVLWVYGEIGFEDVVELLGHVLVLGYDFVHLLSLALSRSLCLSVNLSLCPSLSLSLSLFSFPRSLSLFFSLAYLSRSYIYISLLSLTLFYLSLSLSLCFISFPLFLFLPNSLPPFLPLHIYLSICLAANSTIDCGEGGKGGGQLGMRTCVRVRCACV